MDEKDEHQMHRRPRRGRTLAAGLAAAALAISGGAVVSSAIAADGGSGNGSSATQQGAGTAPVQDESPAPDRDRDCPEKDGGTAL